MKNSQNHFVKLYDFLLAKIPGCDKLRNLKQLHISALEGGIFMADKAMRDMTKGSPMKLILGFLIPMLFGLLFQQFYNTLGFRLWRL